jgi:cupin fold WbuC family metalloprotein
MSVATIIETDNLTEVAIGIFYSRHPIPLVNETVIEFLKVSARSNARRRARFCAHPSPGAEQHDMLIVSHRETYVAPHRHAGKSESFVVLEGFADIMLFNENGGLEQVVKMGPPSSGRPFFYRMPPRQFHSLAIESELLVFIESTKGPFRLDDCENATWAPGIDDTVNGKAYIASILDNAVPT